jgi:hypothetical protein
LNLVLVDIITELSYFPNVVSGNGFQDVRAKRLWEYSVGGKKKAKKSALLTEGEVNALRLHKKAGLLRGGKT